MAKNMQSIRGITVQGFKSIAEEQRIEIRPLTLLAGANSAGKSSFMQPLLLLKQTLESAGDPGAILLDGPNVSLTSAEQILAKKAGKTQAKSFSVRIELSNQSSLEIRFQMKKGEGFEVTRMVYDSTNEKIDITPGMTNEKILNLLPKSFQDLSQKLTPNDNSAPKWMVARDRCFLGFDLDWPETKNLQIRFWGANIFSPSSIFVPFIQSIIHLPGLRGNPQRNYPKTVTGPYYPGTFEMYVASLIYQWQADNDKKLADLGFELTELGLTWKVTAKAIADTQVELRVGRLPHCQHGGAHDLVSIADVGFGVSQSLPVLVALIAASPGQLVYLEQPEIHLHPKAQRLLAHSLCRAAKRGVILLVETHSSLLLREIQTLIATKQLSKNDVQLHWLQRDESGSTIVSTADLGDDGSYGDWPQDFDIIELEAEKAYLDAVEQKMSTL